MSVAAKRQTMSAGSERTLLLYLGGVAVLSAVTVSLLASLFFFRVPSFPTAVVENPVRAIRTEPLAVVLVAAAVLSTLALIALVVGFGARYGLAEPDDRDRRRQE